MNELRELETEVLENLRSLSKAYPEIWFRPMDVGGQDASHHSATLRKLARRGLVTQTRRAGHIRPSYLYRAII